MTDRPVDVRGLCKRYGVPTAMYVLHLRIRPGDVRGLTGPHGAGRSTFVEILRGSPQPRRRSGPCAGADPATAGRWWRSRISIVRQDESAPAELTVREAAGLPGVREDRRR
ncbi:ATP-binding cassette domain-containing protein [Streptomyces sp. NPDC005566]|uniref:ATP-binding cassette domain-containing protein n=1 Tax=Streptomyces sp. NPDC005566 TaxID=3156886 RepID=UPI0033BD3F8A